MQTIIFPNQIHQRRTHGFRARPLYPPFLVVSKCTSGRMSDGQLVQRSWHPTQFRTIGSLDSDSHMAGDGTELCWNLLNGGIGGDPTL